MKTHQVNKRSFLVFLLLFAAVLLSSFEVSAGTKIPVTMDDVCKDAYFAEQDYCRTYKNVGDFVYRYEKEMRTKNYGYYILLEAGLVVAREQLELKDGHNQLIIKKNSIEIIIRYNFP